MRRGEVIALIDEVLERLAVALEKAGYNPGQPRDKKTGRWSHVSGWAEANRKEKAAGKNPSGKSAHSPALAKALAIKEQEIKDLPNERAVLFKPDGTQLFEKDGGEQDVELKDEMAAMKGNVLTHNHPGSASLSDPDLRMATTAGLAEIRATSAKAGLVYSLKTPDGDWKGDWEHHQKAWDKTFYGVLGQANSSKGEAEIAEEVKAWFPNFDGTLTSHIRRVALKRWADSIGASYTETPLPTGDE